MTWTFEPPAGLQDFKDPSIWDVHMNDEADSIILTLVASVLNKDEGDVTEAEIAACREQLAYVHPGREAIPATAKTIPIQPWGAFPRAVDRQAPWSTDFPPVQGDADGTLRAVEDLGDHDHRRGHFEDSDGKILQLPVRHRQDEYLEWSAERDAQGNLTRITFVAEGYDYFSALYDADEKAVVDLYREFTGIKGLNADDLRAPKGVIRKVVDGSSYLVVRDGGFNHRNHYNIHPGIVHLSHRANSLGAEINLAGVSGLARKKVDGSQVDGKDEEELLCCNQGGSPNRNSDPKISQQAYNLVHGGSRYTLANPVGLYIAGVEESGLTLPDGSPVPREWWNVVRGHDLWTAQSSRVLRMELRPPAGEKLTLSQLRANGSLLKFPAQVARLLSVHLYVTHWTRPGGGVGPSVNCIGTCCRVTGTDILLGSDGACGAGTELAFPGLVPPGQGAGKAVAGMGVPGNTAILYRPSSVR